MFPIVSFVDFDNTVERLRRTAAGDYPVARAHQIEDKGAPGTLDFSPQCSNRPPSPNQTLCPLTG
jgi:hypothetical protein